MPEEIVVITPEDSSGWTAWERDGTDQHWENPSESTYAGTLTDGVSVGADRDLYPNYFETNPHFPTSPASASPLNRAELNVADISGGSHSYPPSGIDVQDVRLPNAPSGYEVFDGSERRTSTSIAMRVRKSHSSFFSDDPTGDKDAQVSVVVARWGDISGNINEHTTAVRLRVTLRSPWLGHTGGFNVCNNDLGIELYNTAGVYDAGLNYGYFTIRDDWTSGTPATTVGTISHGVLDATVFTTVDIDIDPALFSGVANPGIRLFVVGDPGGDHHIEEFDIGGLSFTFIEEPGPIGQEIADWRSTLYFSTSTLLEGQVPTHAELSLWTDYVWDDGGSLYLAPIGAADPEGNAPITIATHHSTPFEDKSARAIWSETVASIYAETHPYNLVIPVDISLLEGDWIGFQFGFTGIPVEEAYRFTNVDFMGESGVEGPRLRVYYGSLDITTAVDFEFSLQSVIRILRGDEEEVYPPEPETHYVGSDMFMDFQMIADGGTNLIANPDDTGGILVHRAREDRDRRIGSSYTT